jgi:hypothetical protein
MGVHPMSVQRRILVSSTRASLANSKPRFIPVQLRQPDVASPQGPAADIRNPAGWRLRFPMAVHASNLAPLIDTLR